MNKPLRRLAILGLAPIFALSALSFSSLSMAEDKKVESAPVAKETKAEPTGKELAFSRKKGNCLACHMIQGGEMAGTIAPPLIAMAARFPDKDKLRAQIFDAQVANPDSLMPPFGKHKILSEKELDKVVDFISSL